MSKITHLSNGIVIEEMSLAESLDRALASIRATGKTDDILGAEMLRLEGRIVWNATTGKYEEVEGA